MPSFSLELRGYNRVANNLRRLASDMDKELDPVVGTWTRWTRSRLKGRAYPPKPPRSTYVRTGQLANRWRVEKQGPSRHAIMNDAKGPRGQLYATHVVGDGMGENQAWMHRGRWWIARDVIEEEIPALRNALSTAIKNVWER
jgi:hypothetical protein